MCGISGCIHNNKLILSNENFNLFNNKLINRGPDNQKTIELKNQKFSIKFGHTRLSIQDLSTNANQPMFSKDKRFIIIFNGEIYNHLELRNKITELNNVQWKTRCDTESLLNLIINLGMTNTLKIVEGMFAFVLYDKLNNNLYLVRDRAGEKPLYISCQKNFFAFSSDLKFFFDIPGYDKSINQIALNKYLKLNYIPNPYTIFNNTFKIPPASVLEIDLNKYIFKNFNSFNDLVNSESVNYKKWWWLDVKNVFKNKKFLNYNKSKELTHNLLKNSIQSQLISDVPLGVFLSGGIDSSIVTSILSKNLSNIRTYTIGFEDKDYDESIYAKKIAKYLGTIHTEHIFSKNDIIDLIPRLSETFTEPFADSSQIPTMLLSNITSKNATVALSGDGGDELFCGYNRYIYAKKYWKYISRLPIGLKKSFLFIMNNCPNIFIKFLFSFIFEDDNFSIDNKINKILIKLSHIKNKETFYESMITEWSSTDKITNIENNSFVDNENYNIFSNKEIQLTDCMMFIDFHTYLTDDILCKVDRSSMNYSLEVRAPFLNSKLIELAFDMPLDYKIFQNNSKFILKDILSEYIPKQYFLRPKKGFSIPVSDWIKNDLKDWVNETLSYSMNSKHNLFNQKVIEKTKKEHFEGHFNHEHKLWSLIQFNSWYDKFLN
jgi:asparagine synthase (glutamine-hydrolysing)